MQIRILRSGFSDHSLVICSVFIANKSLRVLTGILILRCYKIIFLRMFCFSKQFSLGEKDYSALQEWWDHGEKRDIATVPSVHS